MSKGSGRSLNSEPTSAPDPFATPPVEKDAGRSLSKSTLGEAGVEALWVALDEVFCGPWCNSERGRCQRHQRAAVDAIAPVVARLVAEGEARGRREGLREIREAVDLAETGRKQRGCRRRCGCSDCDLAEDLRSLLARLEVPQDAQNAASRARKGRWGSAGGICPRCHRYGFIGHGPLCADCFDKGTQRD